MDKNYLKRKIEHFQGRCQAAERMCALCACRQKRWTMLYFPLSFILETECPEQSLNLVNRPDALSGATINYAETFNCNQAFEVDVRISPQIHSVRVVSWCSSTKLRNSKNCVPSRPKTIINWKLFVPLLSICKKFKAVHNCLRTPSFNLSSSITIKL